MIYLCEKLCLYNIKELGVFKVDMVEKSLTWYGWLMEDILWTAWLPTGVVALIKTLLDWDKAFN